MMGISYRANVYVGFLVDPADLFVETELPQRCSQGHEPKDGQAFCPLDGGRFVGGVARAFREPVAAYLAKHGLRVDPDDLDGWLWPRKGYAGFELFDARAQTEPDVRGDKVLGIGRKLATAKLDDGPALDPRSFSLPEIEAIAVELRHVADEFGMARSPDVRVFLAAYCGY